MEHPMTLHTDIKLFSNTLRATAQHLNIKLEFVEKDYWITWVLSHLAKNNMVNQSVFKGGTSLSKGYNLIERFSEDIDIAIINDQTKTGNEIKNLIRTIEKEITPHLTEVLMDGVTSKGSKFRKSIFEYITTEKNNANHKLIVEINAFSNPFPYQRLSIQSMVFDFLMQTGNEKYVEKYQLQPFELNILSKEQTLLEKLISLIRFSFDENPVERLSEKIRHFYDLYYLMKNQACAIFVASDSFKKQFDTMLQQDRTLFKEPKGWQTKLLNESPLMTEFPTIWEQLKHKYQTELSALAYRKIPDQEKIAKSFSELIIRIA
jgi:predicted nucleotidyltransferase component of viral defense system